MSESPGGIIGLSGTGRIAMMIGTPSESFKDPCMSPGDVLLRASIWLALSAYAGAVLIASRTEGNRDRRGFRRWWTIAWAAYMAHVLAAFHFRHDWSHAEALRHTAEETAAITGWRWGGGLWVNYAFTLAWTADVACWRIAGRSCFSRPRWLHGAWHALFLFIAFNAAVVFTSGWARLAGAGLCLVVIGAWWRRGSPGRVA